MDMSDVVLKGEKNEQDFRRNKIYLGGMLLSGALAGNHVGR